MASRARPGARTMRCARPCRSTITSRIVTPTIATYRVYVPLDALAAAGARVEEIGAARSSPVLLGCLQGLAHRTAALLKESEGLAASIRDFRLSLEVAVITAMARRIVSLLA